MAFRDFTLSDLKKKFGLTVTDGGDLFGHLPPVPFPLGLAAILDRYMPLAMNFATEKGRSELLIAPMLVEVRLNNPDRVSVFSGIDFNVDADAGLNGRCDFILARNPLQLELAAPACMLVEAKNENILAGVPQCLAEMIAAQRFNRAEGIELDRICGVVTTGLVWRFMTLTGTTAHVDGVEYTLDVREKIYGILTHIALGTA
jgi:hypothetical protein